MRARTLLLLVFVLASGAVGARYGFQRLYDREHPGQAEISAAWEAVRQAPESPGRWAALADAQVRVDQLRAAESSYRTALRLGAGAEVAGRLGMLLFGRGDDDEALRFLELADAAGAQVPMLESTLAQLRSQHPAVARASQRESARAEGNGTPRGPAARTEATQPPTSGSPSGGEPDRAAAAAMLPVGATRSPAKDPVAAQESSLEMARPSRCEIPVVREGTFRVATSISGQPFRLTVDTGASVTAFDRALLDRLGVFVDESQRINVFTALGRGTMPVTTVRGLRIGDLWLDALQVAVCEACGSPGSDGLLGLDALAALHLELDQAKSVLHVRDCR